MGLVKNIISWFKKTDDNELINKENTNHAITLEQEITDEQSGNTDSLEVQTETSKKSEGEAEIVESAGISYIRKFIEQAEGYEHCKGSRGIPFTRKTSRSNCATLIWVCNDCGFTSKFHVRNDMICSQGIYYCKKCKATQCLTAYYNGHKSIECCLCHSREHLIEWSGDECPKCGGHIVQFNGIKDKEEFSYVFFNFVDDEKMTLEQWLKSKNL